ncbi:MAG: DEAD/DEAH box helicase, partial [Hungatella sp.]
MKNQESIRTLKGVGDKTGKLFEKLGVDTIDDLLQYYPRDYHSYEAPVSIGELKQDTLGTVEGILQKTASVKRFQQLQILTVSLKDETGSLQLIWYNMPFLYTSLKVGTYHIFSGKVVKKKNCLTMEQPEIFTKEAYMRLMQTMQPIYAQTRGLGNKTITKAVAQALEIRRMEREYLPAAIRRHYELAEYNFAIEHIHFPDHQQELLFARKRLVFDEFFLFLLSVRRLKEKREDKSSSFPLILSEEVAVLEQSLPYSLTQAQQKVLREVEQDLTGGLVMNRLIQGDVGSGKTIIAILALLQVACSGYQGALMVPTEVLAKQHYESMTVLFETHGIKVRLILLT